MLIFTVVWPFVVVLLGALLLVAVLQARVTRRLTADQRGHLEPVALTLPIVNRSPVAAPQLDTAVVALADTPA